MTWTKREEMYLKASYPSWTELSEIAQNLDKTEVAIMKKAHRMNLKRNRKYVRQKISITMKTPISDADLKKLDSH